MDLKKILSLFLFFTVSSVSAQYKLTFKETVANTDYEFLGDCELNIRDYNKVGGFIRWSIVKIDRSALNVYKNKMNATAIEYVSGSFDANTKTFSFSGYKKTDVYNLFSLDIYELKLLNGNLISGRTRGTGKWDGIINGKYELIQPDAGTSMVTGKQLSPDLFNEQDRLRVEALNKKSYDEIVRFYKSKYPKNDAVKSLVYGDYQIWIPAEKFKRELQSRDANGNIVTTEAEDERPGHYVWRTGYKNVSTKPVVLMGMESFKRKKNSEWIYTDASVTILPGEYHLMGTTAFPYYQHGYNGQGTIFFFDIK